MGDNLVMADDVVTPSNPPVVTVDKEELEEVTFDETPLDATPFNKVPLDRTSFDEVALEVNVSQ